VGQRLDGKRRNGMNGLIYEEVLEREEEQE